jgi:hypothetical protein
MKLSKVLQIRNTIKYNQFKLALTFILNQHKYPELIGIL